MAETHNEIFRSSIEIEPPDVQSITSELDKLRDYLKDIGNEFRQIFADTGVTESMRTMAAQMSSSMANMSGQTQQAEVGWKDLKHTIQEAALGMAGVVGLATAAQKKYTLEVLEAARASARAAAATSQRTQRIKKQPRPWIGQGSPSSNSRLSVPLKL